MINYTGTFKVIRDIVNWINSFTPTSWLTAEDYDSTKTYYYGQYVKNTDDEKIYKCIVNNTTGTWTAANWEELTCLLDDLSAKPGIITIPYAQSSSLGDILTNVAVGNYSFAQGSGTKAIGAYSHAEGSYSEATSQAAHAEGSSTKASGSSSHTEGYSTKTTASCSHAEGYNSEANGSYSHAEGNSTKANSDSSHAEGHNTKATASYSHAEGYGTEANGMYSHSEGYYTKTGNNCAHSGGNYSEARSKWSFAHGNYAYANNDCEAAFGVYNVTSTEGSSSAAEYDTTARYLVGDYVIYNNKIYKCIQKTPFRAGTFDPSYWQEIGDPDPNYVVFSVGNGSYSARSNAFEVRKDGTCKAGNQQIIAIDPPTTDGTYTLQCTVLNGVPTFTWV